MPLTDNIISLKSNNPKDICIEIAKSVKALRLKNDLTQAGLAARADVNLATYRKFERTGEISLSNLTRIAVALDAASDFLNLFKTSSYQSLDELIKGSGVTKKRGKKL